MRNTRLISARGGVAFALVALTLGACGDNGGDATDATGAEGASAESASPAAVTGTDDEFCGLARSWQVHELVEPDYADPEAFAAYWAEYVAFVEASHAVAPDEIAGTWDAYAAVVADMTEVFERYDFDGEPIEVVDSPILSVAYAPDGGRLATGEASGITRQWSTGTHEQIGAALEGQTGPVAGVAYSPDGSLLATTTLGFSTTRLWDAATGAAVGGDLVGGRAPATVRTFILEHIQGSRPAFSPDGASLAVPNFDGTVTVWDLRPSRWLDAACSLAGRELTDAEWRQFIGTEEPHAICT